MTLDRTFANEINKMANGDGSREYKFSIINALREVSETLGNRYAFDDCLKKHGRAKVGLCVATTISKHPHEYEQPQITWAQSVFKLWTNKAGERSELAATINIHPAILAENSYSLRKLTTA